MLQGKPIAHDKIICHLIIDRPILKIGPKFNNKGLSRCIVLWIGWHLHKSRPRGICNLQDIKDS